jgi:hypothetical protein
MVLSSIFCGVRCEISIWRASFKVMKINCFLSSALLPMDRQTIERFFICVPAQYMGTTVGILLFCWKS